MDASEELRGLADELESLLLAARDDQRNKRWGSYDILLSKYDGIRAALWELREVIPWAGDTPVIATVPEGKKACLVSGGPSITGRGTAAEKAKYTEIVTTCEPLLKRVRRAVDATSEASKQVLRPHTPDPVPPVRDPRKVFVAYGRNLRAKDAMFTFLQSLNLNPLDWPQLTQLTGEGSPGIERAVDKGLETAQGYVVLLTPDEFVEVRPELAPTGRDADRGYQARPNVLVELGQALATDAERTVIVSLGFVRLPSNIGGRYVLKMDNTYLKRHELKLKLETVHLKVVESNQGWLSPTTGGDFDNAVSALAESPTVSRPKVNPGIAARREELVADAVRAFEEWAGGKSPYSTKLYREWIRCGGVPDYVTFDHEMCGRVASELASKGRGTVNPPLKEEYADDLVEGQRQYEYLVSDGTWPPKSARRNRGRWDDSGAAIRNF